MNQRVSFQLPRNHQSIITASPSFKEKEKGTFRLVAKIKTAISKHGINSERQSQTGERREERRQKNSSKNGSKTNTELRQQRQKSLKSASTFLYFFSHLVKDK